MRRRAAERLPWWAATWRAASIGPPSRAGSSRAAFIVRRSLAVTDGALVGPLEPQASWWATRSAILRVLTKTSVVRCSSTCPAIRSRTSENWPAAGHRLELARRELDGHVEVAGVPAVDDGGRAPDRVAARQQAGHHLERALGGGQADALQPAAALRHQVGQPLEAEGEVGPPLVAGQGVDLVDDDRVDAGEHRRERGGGQRAGRATPGW